MLRILVTLCGKDQDKTEVKTLKEALYVIAKNHNYALL